MAFQLKFIMVLIFLFFFYFSLISHLFFHFISLLNYKMPFRKLIITKLINKMAMGIERPWHYIKQNSCDVLNGGWSLCLKYFGTNSNYLKFSGQLQQARRSYSNFKVYFRWKCSRSTTRNRTSSSSSVGSDSVCSLQ